MDDSANHNQYFYEHQTNTRLVWVTEADDGEELNIVVYKLQEQNDEVLH